ncbi:MAG TPA: GNAT family N-acetyltransferase [Patescibacteria group bacterium]
MPVQQETRKPVVHPSSFAILPNTHTSGVRIEASVDAIPMVNRADIAQGVALRLPQAQVHAISLAQVQEVTEIHSEGEETRIATVTKTILHPTESASIAEQTIAVFRGSQTEYGAGSFVEVPTTTILLKELRQFSHQAGIVATGGVDNLIAPEDPDHMYSRSMQATDGVALAMANGLIPQHIVRLIGPAARGASEGVSTAEIYEAVAYNPHSTTHRRNQVSVGKALSLDETGGVHMSLSPNLARDILTHHTWISAEALETDPAQQPFVLVIEGGDGITSVEDAVQAELKAKGIKNAAWVIHAQGEDLRVKGAIIRDLPDGNGVRDLSHLQQLQQPLDFVGGSMTITGQMTPHHPDGALFIQTGLRYERHEHGIGQAPDKSHRGGHINATVLGEHSRAYVVVRPIRDVVEVDASLTVGTRMEAMKLPGAAEHELVLKSIAFKIMGNEVIKQATNLSLTALQVSDLYTLTQGDLGRMLEIMDSTSFRMNLLVQRQAKIERMQQEARQLVREIEIAHLPQPEILNIQEVSWEQIREDIMRVEQEAFADTGFSEEELREMIYDAPNGTTIIQRDLTGRIIAYTSAMAISWDYPERETEDAETAYIESTAIATDYQNYGLVAKLMTALEDELRRKGFQYVERDARVENGWADSVERHYAGRIIGEPELHDSDWGPQKHFRISL